MPYPLFLRRKIIKNMNIIQLNNQSFMETFEKTILFVSSTDLERQPE